MNDNVLKHHGVKGQKWGERNYQNPDGTLTAKGKERAQQLKKEFKSLTGKRLKGKLPKEDVSKKKAKDLTNEELNDRIRRLTNEMQVMGLQKNVEYERASNSKKFIGTIFKEVVKPAAINAGRDLLTNWFKKVGAEAIGLNTSDISDADKAFNKLKRDVDIASLKNKKYQAEQQLRKAMEKDQTNKTDDTNQNKSNNNKSNEKTNNKETNNFYTVYNVKVNKDDVNRGKTIFDMNDYNYREYDSKNKNRHYLPFKDVYK